MTLREKEILAKAVNLNAKRKLGVTTHFAETIELKFGKEMPYVVMYDNAL